MIDISTLLGCFVYVIRGHDGEALYVGSSTNIAGRIGQHLADGQLSSAENLSAAKEIQTIRYATVRAMRNAERELIEEYKPIWNIIGNIKPSATNDSLIAVACEWLSEYLRTYGPSPSAQVRDAAKAHGIKEHVVKRAMKRLGIVVTSKPYPGRPHTTVWQLPTIRDSSGLDDILTDETALS